MFNWLKKLFGFDVPDTPVIAQAPKVETKVEPVPVVEETKPAAKPKSQPKKTTAKKTTAKKPAKQESNNLNAMTKKDLLALAKEKGIKANASLSKSELIKRLG
jgi:hypothetical protein